MLKGGFNFAELPKEIQEDIANIMGYKDEALRKTIARRSELVEMCKIFFTGLNNLPLKNVNKSISANNIDITEIAGKLLYDHQIFSDTKDLPEKLDDVIGKETLNSFLEEFGQDYRTELWQLEEYDQEVAFQIKSEMHESEFFRNIEQYLYDNIHDILNQYKEEQTIINTTELQLMKINPMYRLLFFKQTKSSNVKTDVRPSQKSPRTAARSPKAKTDARPSQKSPRTAARSPKAKTDARPSQKSPRTAARSPKAKDGLSSRSRTPEPRKRGGYNKLVSKIKKMSIK